MSATDDDLQRLIDVVLPFCDPRPGSRLPEIAFRTLGSLWRTSSDTSRGSESLFLPR